MSVLLALLSSVLWGCADFAGGTLSRRRPALLVVGGSQLAGLVAVAVAAAVVRPTTGDGSFVLYAIAAGLAGVIGLVAFYAALGSGTMGIVSPIAALGVVVPVVVGLVAGETPSVLTLVGIVVAVAGIVLASGPELEGSAGARPLVLAAVAALGFGLALLFIARGSQSNALLTMLVMRMTSVAAVAAVAAPLLRRGRTATSENAAAAEGHAVGEGAGEVPAVRRTSSWTLAALVALALAGFADVGANLTFGFASQGAYVSVVSVLGSLYPVVTVLLAMTVHGERLGRLQAVGVTASLAGVVLIAGT